MSTLADQLRDRLREGGWTIKRKSKHEIWEHPNGKIFPLSRTSLDSARKCKNYLKQIERLERGEIDEKQAIMPIEAPLPKWNVWLRKCREKDGLKIIDVESLLNFPAGALNKIELGTRRPSIDEFEQLLQAYKTERPSNLEVSFASEGELAKRAGHAAAKRVSTMPEQAKTAREMQIAEATRILQSPRLLDTEIEQLVRQLKENAIALISNAF